MQTLPVPRLAALLRANAKGYYATEAAARLLTGHETWLHRRDFLDTCILVWTTPGDCQLTELRARVMWDTIPGFLDRAPCSGSEARILRLVAELAGYDTGVPLDELLSGLDDHNSRLVVEAIAHALHLPEPYQEARQ